MATLHEDRTAGSRQVESRVIEESDVRRSFGIAQAIAFAFGVANIVVGAVGLARTGTSDLTGSTTEVAGLAMTGALALIHLVLGILVILGVGTPGAAAGSLSFGGTVALVGGIIALIQQVSWLGWTQANGVAYLVMGGIALGAAMVTREREVVEHRTVSIDG